MHCSQKQIHNLKSLNSGYDAPPCYTLSLKNCPFDVSAHKGNVTKTLSYCQGAGGHYWIPTVFSQPSYSVLGTLTGATICAEKCDGFVI